MTQPAGRSENNNEAAAAPLPSIDDGQTKAHYANFCRVAATPEELIIDLGLNLEPFGVPRQPIVISQRIILNPFTTKRMAEALAMSIERHEAAFGVLETDIMKRARPAALKREGIWQK